MDENIHRIDAAEFTEFENSLNGDGGESAGQSDPGMEKLLEQKNKSLKNIEKAANIMVDMLDSGLKKTGGPGIGDEEYRRDYVDIGMVSLESMAGDAAEREKLMEFLKSAPRWAFGLLTAGWVGRNVLHQIGGKNENKTGQNNQNNQAE